MIRKFEKNDINDVLKIWKSENINAINFYKKNDFTVTSESIDENTNEVEYTMTWNK